MERKNNPNFLDINLLEKIYDNIRYVNPTKKVCVLSGNGADAPADASADEQSCFSFWEKNQVCENCISMRSLRENRVIMKFEYSNSRIYMVTAVPVEGEEGQVVELVRDVTEEQLMNSADKINEEVISKKINALNLEIVTDHLTGLYNRRFLDERMEYELIRSISNHSSIGLIMLDIDHFKNVNDTYGHSAGDQVLIEFSSILKKSIRENEDWVVRYGGEEFLMFLPGINRATLEIKLETIRQTIQKHVFCESAEAFHITSSFGVFVIEEAENVGQEITNLYILNADQALYVSKDTGRNKVTFFEDIL